MLYRIIFFTLFCFSLFSEEHVYLKTPNLSRQEITGTNVGVRPCRRTGVRLEADCVQNKLIIHNYGYGGSGLTLAFGGAKEVLDILNSHTNHPKIAAVLGAGVAGLATAYELLEKGYEVHVYSEKWSPDLTSNVGVGIWSPPSLTEEMTPETKEQHLRMLDNSKLRLLKSTGENPEFAGVKLMNSYALTNHPASVNGSGEPVTIHFDNGVIKAAKRLGGRIGIDGKLFMEDLFSKVKEKGAFLHQKRFEKLEEILQLNEPIIVNCMSFGSRALFNDTEFMPVRGQLVYFSAQNIDYVLSQGIPDSIYCFFVFPWKDRLILGGVYEDGEEELTVKSEVIDEMIRNAEKCLSNNKGLDN